MPGARVYEDGSASPALRRRVEHAVALMREGASTTLVISGAGQPSEAEVGAQIATALGIDTASVLLETRARSTADNAAFCAELVSGRVLVVTDDFHVRRCRWVFAPHFDEVVVVGVVGSRWLRPRLREAASIAKALLRAAKR